MNNESTLTDVEKWSTQEFGDADLGNKMRVDRLVLMAGVAADAPGGRVTEVYKTSAERQAAYKFLENGHVEGTAIGLAAHVACARRCANELFVFVPVDGSSLSVADPKTAKGGLGPVGNRSKRGRGLEVMNAIAVRQDGTPLGLCGQAYWARDETKNPRPGKKRPLEEKETRFWFTAIHQVVEAFVLSGNDCQPWFQLDRGGDFRELLGWAAETRVLLTVRAAQDRRVWDADTTYLWETVNAQPVLGNYTLPVPARPGRRERQATMEVRATPITLRLPNPSTREMELMTLHAVQALEAGTTPADEEPIEWLLLTNALVRTLDEAIVVIFGYSLRWRVEEFHRTWKSVCKIEDTLLEDASRIIKWAIILAVVAMRIERLKFLARKTPDAPSTEELSRNEINATIILRQPQGYHLGDTPPIGLIVRWIADLGGYTGKSSGGPPGSIVIGRGFREIALLARSLSNVKVQSRRKNT